MLGLEIRQHVADEGGEVILRPVLDAEAEVPAGERAFHHDIVRQALQPGVLAQEHRQRAWRGDDDAEFGVAEARMVLDQRERAEVQAGGQRDAVDAGVERGGQAHAQRLARRVHGQLLHTVDEDHAVAALGFHRPAHMIAGGFLEFREVEVHVGLVAAGNVGLVLLQLLADEIGVEAGVGHGLHHGVGNMADAAEARDFERQFSSGDIHAHAADDDRHQFLPAEAQAEIIHTFHFVPY